MNWRAWAIPPRLLLASVLVSVFLLAPLVGGFVLGGPAMAIGVGAGYLALSGPATTLRPIQALALAVPSAMAGAVAVAVRGEPFAAACFVGLCCLLVAPANQLHDSLMAGLPTVVALLVSVPGRFEPLQTGVEMLIGSMVLIAIATRLPKFAPGEPVGQPLAWRHAAVMAISAGGVIWLVQSLNLPHGYWAAVTLTLVLRPYDDRTWRRSGQRIFGTMIGVILALILAALLPIGAVAAMLWLCMVLTVGYSAMGDYPRQVVFLTPAVVLLGATAGVAETAAERALATVVGAVLAGLVALSLAGYEDRLTRKVEAQ